MPGLVQVIPRAGTDPDAPVLALPVVALIVDDFGRADTGPGTLGAPWEVSYNWRVHNGTAACMGATEASPALAVVDTGATDHHVQATLTANTAAGSSYSGLVVRYTDAENYLAVVRTGAVGSARWQLQQTVGGETTTLLNTERGGGTGNDLTMSVTISGTDCHIQIGTIGSADTTVPAPATTATRVGLVGYGATTWRWDDFAAYDREPHA